jgi:hypothetical protein
MGDLVIHPKTIEFLRSGKVKKGGQDLEQVCLPKSLLLEALYLLTMVHLDCQDPGTRARIQLLCKKVDGALET